MSGQLLHNFSPSAYKRMLIGIWLCLAICTAWYHRKDANVLTWDNYGYYLYLPAVLKYQDIKEYAFTQIHHENYQISGSIYQIQATETEKKVPTYLYGMALLYLPFYLLAELIAYMGGFARDGLSAPYQWSIIFGAWVLGLVSMALNFRLLATLFTPKIAFIAIAILLFATNYSYYLISNPASPHIYLFFLYSLLLYLTHKYYTHPTIFMACGIALSVGVLCLSRPSEWVSVFIPVLWGGSLLSNFKKHWQHWFLAVLIIFLVAIPQLLLWKYATGKWLFNPYPFSPDWLNPHVLDGLFSYRKGWFVYTPVMLIALSGLLFRRSRNAVWHMAVLFFFIFNLYMVFTWPMWWYTSSFGMRALVQSYPVMLLPLSAFLWHVLEMKRSYKLAWGLLIGLLAALNIFQAWQYEKRIIPLDGTTKTYYWKVFGKTERDKMLYRFLELEKEAPNRYCSSPTELIYYTALADGQNNEPIENHCTSAQVYCHTLEANVPVIHEKEGRSTWFILSGTFYLQGDRFGDWDEAKAVLSIEEADTVLYWKSVRIQRLTEIRKWTDFKFEFQPKVNSASAKVKAYFLNEGPDTLEVKSFKLSTCESKD
jgi:hypothetical protein